MDIRNVGSPITASQRRSYRKSQRLLRRLPGGGLPGAGCPGRRNGQQYGQQQCGTGTGEHSRYHPHRAAVGDAGSAGRASGLRGHTEQGLQLGAVCNNALASSCRPLSAFEWMRYARTTAWPIRSTGPSARSGAANLLLPEGYSGVDPNRDGIDEVGAARTVHFPPRDALADLEAWFQATAGWTRAA